MGRKSRQRWVAQIGAFMVLWVSVGPVWAASPTEQVKGTVERVVAVLKDPKLQGETKKKDRREQLHQAISPRFGFDEMAKRSLGNHWQRHAARKKEFVPAFANFVEDSYVGKIESYKNEKILYVREHVEDGFAEVRSKVVSNKGDEISLIYKVHLVEGEWKVYDVVIDDISMVNNYHSQFSRILVSASFDELLKRIQGKRLEKES